MKLRVGYVSCNETPADGSLDATLIRVMNCNAYTNGGGYTDGNVYVTPDPVLNPKDPILPPPPPLLEDQPSETLTPAIEPPTMEVQSAIDTTSDTTKGIPPALVIGGGLLLFFLLSKKKRK